MTTTQNSNLPVQLPHAGPSRVGQGTAIEQSRAQSEVYYRVLVAQQVPRNIDVVTEAMRAACKSLRLAEKAFYKLPRSGSTVEGPSVHLARELIALWGNVDYGVKELRQDDEHGQSEIEAFAWDLQTNTRNAQIFIVPHKKDVGRSTRALVQNQEIYENNANAGARRVRECIFAILPRWFVDEAQELCKASIARGDGTPLADRVTAATALFQKEFGVSLAQLEAKLGRGKDRWDEQDVAGLTVTYRSLKNREVTKADEFPTGDTSVTADELAGVDRSDEQIELEKKAGNA